MQLPRIRKEVTIVYAVHPMGINLKKDHYVILQYTFLFIINISMYNLYHNMLLLLFIFNLTTYIVLTTKMYFLIVNVYSERNKIFN